MYNYEVVVFVQRRRHLAIISVCNRNSVFHAVVCSCGDICVFNLVDQCQEYLREQNDVIAAQSPSEPSTNQSLWHTMQQRDVGKEGGGGEPSYGLELFEFDGGLFAEEGDPSFSDMPALAMLQASTKAPGRICVVTICLYVVLMLHGCMTCIDRCF